MIRRLPWVSMLCILGLQSLECGSDWAQAPGGFRFLKSAIQAEKGLDLSLKPECGPWLIYAFSLQGPESKMQSVRLAAELREKFGLTSYIMPKTFDYTSSVVGNGLSKTGGEKRMKFADDRVVESYSILIGDFTSADSPESKATLSKVKSITPEFFNMKAPENVTEAGPMRMAFMIRNPMLPEEWFKAPEMDSFVTELNKKADNSILKCPGRFTVRVAHFTGLQQLMIGSNTSSSTNDKTTLEYAAAAAHNLAQLLRQVGVEAYEYHERAASSVCVGSFDELGAMDANGEFVYSPAILEVVKKYGGVKTYQPSKYGQLPVVKTLLDVHDWKQFPELSKGSEKEKQAKVKQYSIPFEQIPKPIFVPKPATSGLYNKSLIGLK